LMDSAGEGFKSWNSASNKNGRDSLSDSGRGHSGSAFPVVGQSNLNHLLLLLLLHLLEQEEEERDRSV
jgi:hypothetical protein